MAVTVTPYNSFLTDVGAGAINLASDTFKVMLVNDYIFSASHTDISSATSTEIDDGTGYTTGGEEIEDITWGFVVNKWVWDGENITLTATGGSIGPTTGAVIYDADNNKLVAYIDFGAEQTAGEDTDFKITFGANGIFNIQSS